MISAPKTVASRLTMLYALVLACTFGIAFLLSYLVIESKLNDQTDEDLEGDIAEYRTLLRTDGLQTVQQEIDREMASDDPSNAFLRLLDDKGVTIYGSDSTRWDLAPLQNSLPAHLEAESARVFATIRAPDDDYHARVITGRIGPGVILQIGESMEDREELMTLILSLFGATFVVVAGLSVPIGWLMAKRAMSGVEEVTRAAGDVANGALDRKVTVKAKGAEIDRLVLTFNMMVERIQKLISGMREMTDNIAHDLRSPLARIRANAEMALSSARNIDDHKTAAADTLEECDRLLQMINTTLDVAEAEAGAAELEKQEVDLSKMVQDVCELFAPVADDKRITLRSNTAETCRVQGNIQYLQRMLANLLDNALKYTPPNGTVGVDLIDNGGTVRMEIHDTGMGIPVEDQPRIFLRFYRGDQSRSEAGCGLGLSLARAIARAHGGDIGVASQPGSGSCFTVTLPH